MSAPRHVVWFSCGAASAVLAKVVADARPHGQELVVVYCDTSKSEHPDNRRFMREVKFWIDTPITVIRSEKFRTVDEVIAAKSYMSGILGAPCTVEMKKIPRFAFQRADDIHYFGYTVDERTGRREDFEKNNPELALRWPLVDANITKNECFARLRKAGIALPVMYRLGYPNNNCIGCVKAQSPAYWQKIRRDFPEVFAERVRQSREYGVRLAKVKEERVFIDELPEEAPMLPLTESVTCGPECASEEPRS